MGIRKLSSSDWLIVSGIFILTLILFSFKNLSLQREYMEKAVDAEKRGELIRAIDYYERVVLAYTPVIGKSARAVRRLENLCSKLGVFDERLYCYETLRLAVRQIEWLFPRYKDVEARATGKIIEMKLSALKGERGDIGRDLVQDIVAQETHRFKPNPYWSLLASLSLLGWIGSVPAWILLRKKILIGVGILSYTLWLLSLYMA